MDAVERASLVINDRLKSPLSAGSRTDRSMYPAPPLSAVRVMSLARRLEGNEEEMGFNSRFLLDALKNAETDEVRLELSGPLSPMKMLPLEGDVSSSWYCR